MADITEISDDDSMGRTRRPIGWNYQNANRRSANPMIKEQKITKDCSRTLNRLPSSDDIEVVDIVSRGKLSKPKQLLPSSNKPKVKGRARFSNEPLIGTRSYPNSFTPKTSFSQSMESSVNTKQKCLLKIANNNSKNINIQESKATSSVPVIDNNNHTAQQQVRPSKKSYLNLFPFHKPVISEVQLPDNENTEEILVDNDATELKQVSYENEVKLALDSNETKVKQEDATKTTVENIHDTGKQNKEPDDKDVTKFHQEIKPIKIDDDDDDIAEVERVINGKREPEKNEPGPSSSGEDVAPTSLSLFQKFMEKWDSLPGHGAEDNKIKAKIWNWYYAAHDSYIHSQKFINGIKQAIEGISESNQYVILQMMKDQLKKFKDQSYIEKVDDPNEWLRKKKAENSTNKKVDGEEKALDPREQKKELRLKRLERKMMKVQKEIDRLECTDVDLDDEDNSSYLLLDRYKRYFMRMDNAYCNIANCSNATGRPVEKKFKYAGSRYPEINKRITAWVNKRKEFPEYMDILGLVKKVTKEDYLPLRPKAIRNIAEDIFREVGRLLKKRRQKDDLFSIYAYAGSDVPADPAEINPELYEELKQNGLIAQKNFVDVFQMYVDKEMELKKLEDVSKEESDGGKEEDKKGDEMQSEKEEGEEMEIIPMKGTSSDGSSQATLFSHSEECRESGQTPVSNDSTAGPSRLPLDNDARAGPSRLPVDNESIAGSSKIQVDNDARAGPSKIQVDNDARAGSSKIQVDSDARAGSSKIQVDSDARAGPSKIPEGSVATARPSKIQVDSDARAGSSKIQVDNDARAGPSKIQVDNDARAGSSKIQVDSDARAGSSKIQVDSDARAGPSKIPEGSVATARPSKIQVDSDARAGSSKIQVDSDARAGPSKIPEGSVATARPSKIQVDNDARAGPSKIQVDNDARAGSSKIQVDSDARAGPSKIPEGSVATARPSKIQVDNDARAGSSKIQVDSDARAGPSKIPEGNVATAGPSMIQVDNDATEISKIPVNIDSTAGISRISVDNDNEKSSTLPVQKLEDDIQEIHKKDLGNQQRKPAEKPAEEEDLIDCFEEEDIDLADSPKEHCIAEVGTQSHKVQKPVQTIIHPKPSIIESSISRFTPGGLYSHPAALKKRKFEPTFACMPKVKRRTPPVSTPKPKVFPEIVELD